VRKEPKLYWEAGHLQEPILACRYSYVNLYANLCNFNPELWQVYFTTLAFFRIILRFCSLIEWHILLGHKPIIMAKDN
jgi:hypothetical protein